jgi:hypothetical protein
MVEKILSYSQISYLSCGFVKKYIKCTNVLALVFLVHKIYKKHKIMLSFYHMNDRTAEQPQSPEPPLLPGLGKVFCRSYQKIPQFGKIFHYFSGFLLLCNKILLGN